MAGKHQYYSSPNKDIKSTKGLLGKRKKLKVNSISTENGIIPHKEIQHQSTLLTIFSTLKTDLSPSRTTPQISQPLLQMVIFTMFLFRIFKETTRELPVNMYHIPRAVPHISDILSPLIKSRYYLHFAYEEMEVLRSHLPKVPQLMNQAVQFQNSQHHTTQP